MNVNMYFNTYNVGYLTTVSTQKPKKNRNCYIKPQFKFAFFDRRHFLVCMQPRCDHDTPPCSSILWHCPRVGDPFTYIFWNTFGVLIFSVSNLIYIKKIRTMLAMKICLFISLKLVLLEGRLSIWHIIQHLLPVSIFCKYSFLWFNDKRVNLKIASTFEC